MALQFFPDKPFNLTVGSEINRGGWGVVYEGDLDGRPVAVKNIHELLRQVGKEELGCLLGSFREECARLQGLKHPHIVGKVTAICLCVLPRIISSQHSCSYIKLKLGRLGCSSFSYRVVDIFKKFF